MTTIEGPHPLLTLWRTALRHDFAERSADILALLAEVTRFPTDDDQRLVTDVLWPARKQGHYAWLIATKLSHRLLGESDLVMSWVAVAAAAGSAPACIALLQVLADGTRGNVARRAFISWLRTAREAMPDVFTTSGRRAWIMELATDWEYWPASGLFGDQQKKPVEKKPLEKKMDADTASGPTLIVLDGELDSSWGDGGRTRYEHLTEPLPLLSSRRRASELERILMAEFPWMQAVVELLVDDLFLAESLGRTWFKLKPVLLVGPPGTGKTRLCRRVAELAGLPYQVVTAGGASDNRSIQGTSRGYSSAEPSLVLKLIADANCANPISVVDELDKSSRSRRNGALWDTLLSLLEPETARRWVDECLAVPADLSQVSWLLTANAVDGLPAPLLSRISVARVPRPGPENFAVILDGVLADLAADYEVDARLLPRLDADAVRILRRRFGHGASIREVKSLVLRVMSRGARTRPAIVN